MAAISSTKVVILLERQLQAIGSPMDLSGQSGDRLDSRTVQLATLLDQLLAQGQVAHRHTSTAQ